VIPISIGPESPTFAQHTELPLDLTPWFDTRKTSFRPAAGRTMALLGTGPRAMLKEVLLLADPSSRRLAGISVTATRSGVPAKGSFARE
jgi:hypothetical protein